MSLKPVLYAVARWFCRPLRVLGRERLSDGPVVFVANHASHADTAAVLAAVPRAVRGRLAPAAAEDYFFKTKLKGSLVTALTGAFPFPRHGCAGLERAWSLLSEGRSVLLFPEGTRSRDGSIGDFRCGAGILAGRGATIVPVGIAGSRDVFPKGSRWPRRAPVAVAFGEPLSFESDASPDLITKGLRDRVCDLEREARRSLAPIRPTLHQRVADFARSRAALWMVFVWAVAEAMWWPLIPDFLIAPLALAAPGRALLLATVASAGSVAGGTLAMNLGPAGAWLADHAPLVTPRMSDQAVAWMKDEGATGLLRQPLSGIPYKVFALRAGDHVALPGFVAFSLLARGLRMAGVAAIFAGGGIALSKVWPRFFGLFLIAYCVVFSLGFAATVESWK